MANEELNANQVLCAVLGIGLLEADVRLQEVSAQSRSDIVEAYEADEVSVIHAILEEAVKE
jgi:hypothetical protein